MTRERQNINHESRAMDSERRAIARFLGPVWDSCEIKYRIRRAEAVGDISLCDELPAGWIVQQCSRAPENSGGGWTLVFDVQGEPRQSDGATVYRILQRLGAL